MYLFYLLAFLMLANGKDVCLNYNNNNINNRVNIVEKNFNESVKLLGLSMYNDNDVSLNKVRFLIEIGKLKQLERSGWLMNNIHSPERIGDHMWRMAVIPLFLSNNYSLDINKVIKLALIHDIAECIIGDFTPYDNISPNEKHLLEEKAIHYLGSLLPSKVSQNFIKLYKEYEEQKSDEAIFTKELDRFDLILQAFEYERLEYRRTGQLPDLEEFFDYEHKLSHIHNPELKKLLSEILHQRSVFLVHTCGKCE